MKALDRKLLRDLRLMWSQALTIALVVASGLGGFVATLSAVDSLALARDRFYAEGRFADLFQHLLVLVRADKQSSGKGIEAFLAGDLRGSPQTQAVALGTTVSLAPHHGPEVLDHLITLANHERQAHFCGQELHRLQPLLVFGERMDVGIIPADLDFKLLFPQPIYHPGGTGAAAGMQEDRCHGYFP